MSIYRFLILAICMCPIIGLDIPPRATILVIGGPDAKNMTSSLGVTTLLSRKLRKADKKYRWQFTYHGTTDMGIAKLKDASQAAVTKIQPDAILLKIGQMDAYRQQQSPDALGTEQYRGMLGAAITSLATHNIPIIIGSPCLIGEQIGTENPYNQYLDMITQINQAVATKHGLTFFNSRATLTAWLERHNTKDKARGLLTSDGKKLRRSAHELLLPTLAQALGVQVASDSKKKKKKRNYPAPPPANSTVMIVGDKGSMKGMEGGVKQRAKGWIGAVQESIADTWQENHVTLYIRTKSNGGTLFASAAKLSENVESQVISIQPSCVVLLYGFTSTDPTIAAREAEKKYHTAEQLTGLEEAVTKLVAKDIRVILISPVGGGDALREKRGMELEKEIATIAAQTGATHFRSRDHIQTVTALADVHKGIAHAIAEAFAFELQ